MSEANKATLQKANAAIIQGDNEGFLHFCTEDTRWDFLGDKVLEGKDAVRQWMVIAYAKPPQFKVTALIADGDHVAALGEIDIDDATGNPVRHAYCDVWRFRDGKMAELKAFVVAPNSGT